MHIHLPLSWDYLLFVWAPSSLRQVTGSCIHEGEACPDKTWIRDYQSVRSRNRSPDKKRSRACRSVTDHFWEGGGKPGWHVFTLSPSASASQVTRNYSGNRSLYCSSNNTLTVSETYFDEVPRKAMLLTVFRMVSVLFMIWILWYLGLSGCLWK